MIFLEENNSSIYYRAMEHFLREKCLKKFKIYNGVDFGTFKIQTAFLSEIFSCILYNTLSQISILNSHVDLLLSMVTATTATCTQKSNPAEP